jgi:hypothetical protein
MLLNMKHGLEFAWAVTLANGLIWLGKFAIVALNCFTGWVVMKYVMKDLEVEGANPVAPMIVIALISYLTADLFLSMFDESVQALMTCLLIDIDMHGGTPSFGPQTFHDKLSGLTSGGGDSDDKKGSYKEPKDSAVNNDME